MLNIKKEYMQTNIVYEFDGFIGNHDLKKIETMMMEDMVNTYTFIFNFKNINYIDMYAIQMLKKVYLLSVDYACEIKLTGLQAQPETILELFQMDKLYTTLQPVNNVYGDENESLYYA